MSQRIFEGLAYGCIVLSNSMAACEQTNNIVIHISTMEDIERVMEYYLRNPPAAHRKRIDGYNFSKHFGTNQYAAQPFIDVIREKFELDV